MTEMKFTYGITIEHRAKPMLELRGKNEAINLSDSCDEKSPFEHARVSRDRPNDYRGKQSQRCFELEPRASFF